MSIKLKPTEIEILLHNLYNKAIGESDNSIPECNLYSEKEPWEIWEACNDGTDTNKKELYVFTKVKKKTVNGSRLDRTVGTGAWKGEDTGVKIYGNDQSNIEGSTTRLVGMRKRFRYESRTVHEGRWIMYEYSLDASTLIHAKFQNYVLCRIKKMEGISEKKRKLEQEENQEIIKVNDDDDESTDSEPQLHICNKSKKTTKLQREENNNNGGIPATVLTTTTNPDDNTRLPINGDHYIIIDLSDSDDEPNIIGTTPVEKQFDSPESPSGEFSTIPGILDPNCSVDDDHTDWAKAFAKELTAGQAHLMEETQIDDQILLPNNAYYLEN